MKVFTKTEWVTYTRYDGHTSTKESSVKRPLGYSDARPATEDEISAEIKRRADRQRQVDLMTAFQSRNDYRDACFVRTSLDVMGPDNDILDRLTPQEWAELRKKLTAERGTQV